MAIMETMGMFNFGLSLFNYGYVLDGLWLGTTNMKDKAKGLACPYRKPRNSFTALFCRQEKGTRRDFKMPDPPL